MIVERAFLFTDIEGSTRLWEERPDDMRLALARHDQILREAIAESGGEVFKTVGDAFCAAFEMASAAAEAAKRAQTSIAAEPWPGGIAIRVRMAINAGLAERRDDDYFGPPLNRVARLMGVAYGGQTLVSAAAREKLPDDFGLRELGEHRLRDLQRAEPIFQLAIGDSEESFPPLRSVESFPNNLPLQVASFVGRERELATLRDMVHAGRLVTLLGAGGAGKTRLAIQTAADVIESFPDGVWLVELAGHRDPERLADVVADSLGVRQNPGRTREAELFDYLGQRRLFLVLDNCEHLLDASARLVDRIARQLPGISILSTSRAPLGISGEATYRVPSLALPPESGCTPAVAKEFESVRLFLDRAHLVAPDFVLDDSNVADVAELVRRLDGIPLAIELAASRIRVLSPKGILDRLQDRFRLLTGGSRAALPRHQTLQALIDWSFDLLDEEQRTVFCRLAAFRGGWTLDEAEHVVSGGAIESWQALDVLTALVDRSLVAYESDGRYRFLETVREYASDKLSASGEADSTLRSHAAAFLDLALRAGEQLQGPEAGRWMDRLEPERENLRLAVETLIASGGVLDALRLTGALIWFWDVRAYWRDGLDLLDRALSAYAEGPPCAELAAGLRAKGLLAMASGDLDLAEETFRQNVAVAREIGDRLQVARAIHNRALVRSRRGRGLATVPMFEESLLLFRELGDGSGETRALLNIALVLNDSGDAARAEALYTEALGVAKRIQDDRVVASCLNNLGAIAHEAGRDGDATKWHLESLAVRERLGDRPGIATSHHNLGMAALGAGDLDAASEWLMRSFDARREMQDELALLESVEGIACLAAAQKDFERAARLFGAAEAQRARNDWPMHGTDQLDYAEYRRATEAARGDLLHKDFALGESMDWEEALRMARYD